MPHLLDVGQEDLDGPLPLLGQGVGPVAGLPAGAEGELLGLGSPRVDELPRLGDGELGGRLVDPGLVLLADLLDERRIQLSWRILR